MDALYSLRMRASQGGKHISGAEKIIRLSGISDAAHEMVDRAMSHERGLPDSVTLSFDPLDGKEVINLTALPVSSIAARDVVEARKHAAVLLADSGVAECAAHRAIILITTGPAPDGGTMRGAMILDAATGERLEPDQTKGVRAREVDYREDAAVELDAALHSRGMDTGRLQEALALATKVSGSPGFVAELCISDNPDYLTGYVTSLKYGYVRISPLKENGDMNGGRAFFVDRSNFDLQIFTHYMREVPVLVTGPFDVR
jgi:6-carboxyhexanoate--CoA ligase